jgi:acetyl-CoA acetyltransferase
VTNPIIAGLGLTEMGKVYGRTANQLAADAVRLAVADAGLQLSDLDGLLTSSGVTGGVNLGLHRDLGLHDLRLLAELQSYGATATNMMQYACLAIQAGLARAVACVFADDPLKAGGSAGAAYSTQRSPSGWLGLTGASGIVSTNSMYALAARRHMERYGTTSEQLGHIAVAQREWASMNPLAQLRTPITLADHQASRWIAEPLHLLDCCLVSNGGVAVVVTAADLAPDLPNPAVHVLGWGQSHPGYGQMHSDRFGLVTGAAEAGPAALQMAGVGLEDIDFMELYDCYTYTVMITLEDYGVCGKGEGGPLVASGILGPAGKLKLNTGGGQLSSFYMWGMTPVAEAVIQVRGQAGERQVDRHELALVSGNGGILDHHGTLVLGAEGNDGPRR